MSAIGTGGTAGAGEHYTVKLDTFEGPLDLLLHLIKKHEVDLYEIRVSQVTDQYLAYLKAARELNLDIAGEFLVMAATLIYLKSRALLPPEERDEFDDEEPLDPEAQLIQQLIEHERFQKVAAALAQRPVLGRDVFRRTVVEHAPGEFVEPMRPVGVGDLLLALQRVLNRRANQPVHRVAQEQLSLRDGLELVLDQLRTVRRAAFEDLFPADASRRRIIVTFLAILELIKVGALTATQEAAYGAIEVALLRDLDPDSVLAIDFEGAEA
ncbi:MAG: segregation/condensation protein A [Thermodesulfobacteriota bacterium]